MKKLLWSLSLFLITSLAVSQDIYHNFADHCPNDAIGYGNVVYDYTSDDYSFAELDSEWMLSPNSAIHLKKINSNEVIISERYFVTDYDSYSGHYIEEENNETFICKIFNKKGEIIYMEILNQRKTVIDVSHLENAVYTIEIEDTSNKVLDSMKLNVSR